MDGGRQTHYDDRPCPGCGGRVELASSRCTQCKRRINRPQPGPQEQFLACPADIVLFGGGVGSGKTFALLLDAACYQTIPGWVGAIFRHHHKDLKGAPGVVAKARKMFSDASAAAPRRSPVDPAARVRFRESSPLDMRWPSGATLEFRHLDEENYEDYQGLEYAWIGLEEATHYEWHWVRYLITRLRTDTGVQTLVRMTCNPQRNHWLREWVDWYLLPDGFPDRAKSGVLRYFAIKVGTDDIVWGGTREECAELAGRDPIEVQSFSYIASLFDDNTVLKSVDPTYVARVAVGGAVDEQRLRFGNWNATHEVSGMLARGRWGGVDGSLRRPLAPIVKWVRAWDKAATKPSTTNPNPDFTAGVLMGWDIHGRFYIAGLAACREEPPEVSQLQRSTAQLDGKHVTQSAKIGPGDTGKSDFLVTRRILRAGGGGVVSVRESNAKTVRVRPMADALYFGMRGTLVAESHDAPGQWLHRGWILNPDEKSAAELGIPHCADWLNQPYHDAGTAPSTLGDLFWSQVEPFFNPKKKDDIPDAMADGFAFLSRPPSKETSELDAWRDMYGD